MAEQLPETPFERASQDARDKERLDRQKVLVSLPRGKSEQAILALLAEKTVEAHEELEVGEVRKEQEATKKHSAASVYSHR